MKPVMNFTMDGVKGKPEGVKKMRQLLHLLRETCQEFHRVLGNTNGSHQGQHSVQVAGEEKINLEESKTKICEAIPLGVPRAKQEIVFFYDGSNVGGGGTLFQWQTL